MILSTRGTGWVLGGLTAVLLCALAVEAYFHFRGPVGGVSPYEEVNELVYELYGQDKIVYALEQETYPADVETLVVNIRNGAPDGALVPEDPRYADWVLEIWSDGAWHTLRTVREDPKWSWLPEDCGPGSRPSGIVHWDGGEQTYLCDVAEYYRTPLERGRYRVVFLNMAHMIFRSELAMEFEVE